MQRQLIKICTAAGITCGLVLALAQLHAAPEDSAKMLRHVVLFKFKEDATKDQIQEIVDDFGQLPQKIDSVVSYEHGVNNSPEMRSKGFTHCFLVTFKDEKGRDKYLPHPAHNEFVQKLLPLLDDVLVVDYWTTK